MLSFSSTNKYKCQSRSGGLWFAIVVGLILSVSLIQIGYHPVQAAEGVPELISYQGRLYDASGNLLGGSGTDYYFRFSIYDATSGGTKLWPAGTPSTMTYEVRYGVFNAQVGDTSAGGDALTLDFNADEYYLQVEVASLSNFSDGETLSPRQRVTSAGYAKNADTVDGYHASTTPVAEQVVALNSSGDLEFGTTAPTIQAQTGLTLQTTVSGDINLSPSGQVKIINATTTQLTIGYDASNRFDVKVASDGAVTLDAVGSDPEIIASDDFTIQGQVYVTGTATSTIAGDVDFDSGTLYVDSVNNRVGVNITNPIGPLHISDGNSVSSDLVTADYGVISAQNTAPGFSIVAAASYGGHRPVFKGTRSRGTLSSPTVPFNNDDVLTFLGAIYDGSDTEGTAGIFFKVDGTVSNNVAPQRISFVTSETNATSRQERLTVKSDGKVGINIASPSARLEILETSGEIFRMTGSGGYIAYTISGGDLTMDATGGDFYLGTNDNFHIASTDLFMDSDTALGDSGSSNTDSGAYHVGAYDEFTNSASTNVQGVLKDLDTAIVAASSGGVSSVTAGDGLGQDTTTGNLNIWANPGTGITTSSDQIAIDTAAALTWTGVQSFNNVSSTNLTVSGNSYLGTIQQGIWNGTAIDVSSYTNLSVTATGLQLSGDAIALQAGYNIPLTASTTNWNTFYDTPSTRITAGNYIDWSGNTLNVTDSWYNSVSDIPLTNGYVLRGSSGNTAEATSSLFIADSGNVGVGTSTPQVSFHLQGIGNDENTGALIVTNSDDKISFAVDNDGGIFIHEKSSASADNAPFSTNDFVHSFTDNSLLIGNTAGGYGFQIVSNQNRITSVGGTARKFYLSDSGGDRITIDPTAGHVGIGTTSPTVLLTVGSSTPGSIPSNNYYNSAYVSGDLEVDGTLYANISGTSSSSVTSTYALNLAGGAANQIPYQNGVNSTTFMSAAANSILATNGSNVPSLTQTLPTAVQGNITQLGTITSGVWNGTAIGPTYGGTGQTTYAQGDLLYASAANTLSKLPKNTSATRYLSNTGASNSPAWAQINLSNGVTGTLPVNRGGTGAATLASNGILYGNGTGAIQVTTAAANSILATNGSNVPSLTQTLPTTVQGNITQLGTITSGTWQGTAITPTYGGLGFNASGIAKGGLITGTGSGTFGIQTVGANGLCLTASSTAASGVAWSDCATASGAITSLNGLTAGTQTFATSTSGGLQMNITSSGSTHTFALQPASGYTIPLTASTTNWNTFYDTPSTRITAGNYIDWSGNTLNVTDSWYNSVSDIPLTNGYVLRGSSGNTAEATSTLFIADSGNVGVGTTTPSQDLHIYDDTAGFIVESNTGSAKIDWRAGPSAIDAQLGRADDTIWANLLYANSTTFGDSKQWAVGLRMGDSDYHIYSDANTFEAATFLQSGDVVLAPTQGNVGIGTTTPAYKLDIQGTAGINPFNISSSTGANLVTVLQNGNVGIGIANPAVQLDIASGSGIGWRLYEDPSNYVQAWSAGGYLHQETTSGNYYMKRVGGGTASVYVIGDGVTHNRTQYSGNGISIQDTSYISKTWLTGVGNSYFNGGNLGIGTSTPTVLLTVGSSTPGSIPSNNYYNSAYVSGDLEVDGTLYANISGTSSSSVTSTYALNLAGGAANQIPYQNGVNSTTFMSAAANSILATNGSNVPSLTQTLPTAVQGNITSLGTITSGVWNGTAIGPTYGGTGQTTVSTGDLLYGSASNTWSKLSGPSAGNQVLRSSAANAFAWGALQAGDLPSDGYASTYVNVTGDTMTGGLSITSAGTGLSVTNNATIGGTLAVSGAVSASSSLAVTGTGSFYNTIYVEEYIQHLGDTDTSLRFTDDSTLIYAGGELLANFHEDATQDYVKFGDGGDVDIHLNENRIFIEGSSGRVGISTSTPTALLTVQSTSTSDKTVLIRGISSQTANIFEIQNAGGTQLLTIDPNGRAVFTSATSTNGIVFNQTGTGNIAQFQVSSTPIFTIGQTLVSSEVPLSVNSTGDTGLAGNLIFTNPTASYIKSDAPLYIQAGDLASNESLYLSANNAGIVVVEDNLLVEASSTQALAKINNTGGSGSGNILQLQNNSSDVFTVDNDGDAAFSQTVTVSGTSTLATTTIPNANALVINNIALGDSGSSNTDSGAYLVGAYDEFTNSASTNVQGVLKDLDTAIVAASSGGVSSVTAGDGLGQDTTTGNLNIWANPGTGITTSSDQIAIDTAAALTWTGAHTFSNTLTANSTFDANGVITLGDGGDTFELQSTGIDITTGGVISNATWQGSTVGVQYGGTGAATLASNGILYGNGTGAIQVTTAAANSILTTNGSNVPSLTQTLPSAVQGNITQLGTITSGTWQGTAIAPTYGGLGFNASGIAKGGLITGTGSGTFGIQTVGANGLCLTASSTAASGVAWSDCATASGAITSLNGLTAGTQTFATSTSGGLQMNITSSGSTHTFALQPASGYTIPLTASTTEWTNFYNTPSTRITAGNYIDWSGNTLNVTDSWYNSVSDIPLTNGYVLRGSSGNTAEATSTLFIADSGNVGIGTTSPETLLEIYKNNSDSVIKIESATDNAEFRLKAAQDEYVFTGLYHGASRDWYYGLFPNSDDLKFYNDGFGEVLTLQNNTGYVGIGTSTPAAKLHVYNASAGAVSPVGGTTMVLENNTTNYLSLLSPDASYSGLVFGSPSDSFGGLLRWNQSGGLMELGTANSGDDIALLTGNSSEAVRITSAGYVGIGTTTPAHVLDVAGGTNSIARIQGSNSANLLFDSGVTNSWGIMNGYVNGGKFQITKGSVGSIPGTSVMTFDTDGNVGIGTASPGKKLEVAGDVLLNGYGIYFDTNSAYHIKDSGNNIEYSTYGAHKFETYDGSGYNPLMVLTGGGGSAKVGIGTTTPTVLLTVGSSTPGSIPSNNYYNSAYVSGDLEVDGTLYANISGTSSSSVTSTYALNLAGGAANQIPYQNGVNSTTFMSAAANSILATNGSSVPSLTQTLPSAVQGNITSLGTITSGVWNGTAIDISSYTNLSVTATGLQLSGDAIALQAGYNIPLTASTTNWNTFYDTPSTRITAGNYIDWSGNTLNVTDSWYNSVSDIPLTNGYVLRGSSGNTAEATSSLFIADSGNVGVGTTTPDNTLQVAGVLGLLNANSISSSEVTLDAYSSYGLKVENPVGYINITPLNGGWAHIYTDRSNFIFNKSVYAIGGKFASYSTADLTLSAGGSTNDLTVQNATGNIGIGTTNPGKKLTVGGDAVFRDSSEVDTSSRGIEINPSTVGSGYHEIKSWGYADGLLINSANTGTGDAGSQIQLETAASADIIFRATEYGTPMQDRVIIKGDSGYLGIGTTTPTVLLTVGSSTPGSIPSNNYYNSAYVSGDLEVDGTLYANISGTSSSSVTSTYALNLAGGAANQIPYQNGVNSTTFMSAAANSILATNGSNVPSLTQTLPTAVQGNITQLGTITSGVWNGTAIDVSSYTNLGVSATGLTLSGDSIALSAGYNIPLTASTTNWNTFYDTPSTRITAGNYIDWSGNTLNVTDSWYNSLGDISLTSANIIVGNGSNVAAAVAMSGDVTISNTGVTSIGNDKVTPDDVLSTGKTDEYCLTYESSGDTWAWQTCGTTTSAAGSDGQIQYNNGGTAFGGASALYYDDGNNWIGMGTTTPTGLLTLQPSAGDEIFRIASSSGAALLVVDSDGNFNFDEGTLFIDTVNNRVGIGTTTPQNILDVVDPSGVSTLRVVEGSSQGGANLVEIQNTSGNNLVYINASGGLFASSTLAVTGAATFYGATTINNTVNVTGQTTLANASTTNLTVSNNSYLGTVQSGTWNGTAIGPTYGGTGQTTYAQGDLLYASAANTLSKLPKNTSATRYLSNTGASNSPAWAQINLSNGVTGTLPVNRGGTGAATLASNGILYGNGTGAIQVTTAAANSILATNGSNVPSLTQTLPTTVQGNITQLGTITSGVWNGSAIDISSYTNLGVSATGLTLSGDSIALSAGYNIPLTASTTNWNTFYDTPSNRITAGTGLSWAGNTLNASGGTTISGTDNYIARFNAAGDNIENSGIVDNSNAVAMTIDTNEQVGIGTTTPAYKLDIQGTAGVNPFNIASSTGANLVTVLQSGNVGIGTASPQYNLDVAGSIGINDSIYHNGDSNTHVTFYGDQIILSAGAKEFLRVIDDSEIATIINDNSEDIDFRVESDNNTHALFVRGSDGNVGIGTNSPARKLDVSGSIRSWDGTNAGIQIGQSSTGSDNAIDSLTAGGVTGGAMLHLNLNSTGNLSLGVGGGNVGVGTTTPAYKLTVAGDAYITGALRDSTASAGSNGMVLQTTGSGTQWVATSSLGISGGGTPAGVNTQVQFNDSGSFGGDSGLTYNKSTDVLTVGNVTVGLNTVNVPAGSAYQIGGVQALVSESAGGTTLVGPNARGNTGTTAIGDNAGNSSSNGSVFIGTQAGYNETGDNKLYIDNSNTASPLVYGDFSSDILAVNGNLGIGTSTPASTLHIQAAAGVTAFQIATSTGATALSFTSGNQLRVYDSAGTNYVSLYHDGTDAQLQISSGDLEIGSGGGDLRVYDSGGTDYLQFTHDGTDGNIDVNTGIVRVGTTTVFASTIKTGGGTPKAYNSIGSGLPGQGAISGNSDLFIAGDLEVDGTAYLAGGTAWTQGDFAERMTVLEPSAQAGDLLVANNTDSQEMSQLSYSANSNQIVGVISTNPAGILKNEIPGEPVALTGTVPLKVTVENGPIKRGDKLTTSGSILGAGMKATDPDAGTVGIALENYNASTTGYINILLNINNPVEAGQMELVDTTTTTPSSTLVLETSSSTATSTQTTSTNIIEGDSTASTTTSTEVIVTTSTPTTTTTIIQVINQTTNNTNVTVIDYEELGNIQIAGVADFQGKIKVVDAEFTGRVLVKGDIIIDGDLDLRGALTSWFWQSLDETQPEINLGDAVAIRGDSQVAPVFANSPDFQPAVGMVVAVKPFTSLSALDIESMPESLKLEYQRLRDIYLQRLQDITSPSSTTSTTTVLNSLPLEQVAQEFEKFQMIKVAISGLVKGYEGLLPGSRYYLALDPVISKEKQIASTADQEFIDLVTANQELLDQSAALTGDQEENTEQTASSTLKISRTISSLEPIEEGAAVQILGIAKSATELLIQPSFSYGHYQQGYVREYYGALTSSTTSTTLENIEIPEFDLESTQPLVSGYETENTNTPQPTSTTTPSATSTATSTATSSIASTEPDGSEDTSSADEDQPLEEISEDLNKPIQTENTSPSATNTDPVITVVDSDDSSYLQPAGGELQG